MYTSLDLLSHKLTRMLGKFKDKYRHKDHDESIGKVYADDSYETVDAEEVQLLYFYKY